MLCDIGILVFFGILVFDEMVGRVCVYNVFVWDCVINMDIIRKNYWCEGCFVLCFNVGVVILCGLLFLVGCIVGMFWRCVGWLYWLEILVKFVVGGLLWIGMWYDYDMINCCLDVVIFVGGCVYWLGGVVKVNLCVGICCLFDVVLDVVDGVCEGLEGSNVVVVCELVEVLWLVICIMEDLFGFGLLVGIRVGL